MGVLKGQRLSLMELGDQVLCLLGLAHQPATALATVRSRSPILIPPQKHGVSFLPMLGRTLALSQVLPIASVPDLSIMDKCR